MTEEHLNSFIGKTVIQTFKNNGVLLLIFDDFSRFQITALPGQSFLIYGEIVNNKIKRIKKPSLDKAKIVED